MVYPRIEVLVNVKDLDRLTDHLAQRLDAVVEVSARRVEKRAKAIVPVDTGATKNSIAVHHSPGSLMAEIGPTTHYAPYLEFGTRHMAARPFMTMSLESERARFLEAVRQVLAGRNSGESAA